MILYWDIYFQVFPVRISFLALSSRQCLPSLNGNVPCWNSYPSYWLVLAPWLQRSWSFRCFFLFNDFQGLGGYISIKVIYRKPIFGIIFWDFAQTKTIWLLDFAPKKAARKCAFWPICKCTDDQKKVLPEDFFATFPQDFQEPVISSWNTQH